MKKILILTIIGLFLSAMPVMAEMYVGIGGSYVYENFDAGVDFGDGSGINLKAGYVLNDNVAIELSYDYLQDFDYSDAVVSVEADIETLMAAVKISTGEELRTYLIGGLGVMRGELTAEAFGLRDSASENDLCAKAGAGIDYFVTDEVSVGVEGAYVWGFGDLDGVEYTQVTCGVAYHF